MLLRRDCPNLFLMLGVWNNPLWSYWNILQAVPCCMSDKQNQLD